MKAKPHLSTIWTRSSASSQKLLSAELIQYLSTRYGMLLMIVNHTLKTGMLLLMIVNYTLKTGMLIYVPWKRACWFSSPFGSPWTLSGPLRESPGRSHWSPGSLLRRKTKYFLSLLFHILYSDELWCHFNISIVHTDLQVVCWEVKLNILK